MKDMPKRLLAAAAALVAAFAANALADSAPLELTPRPVRAAKAPKSGPAAQLSAAEAVARANAWLDSARVLTADFVQIGPGGKRSEGQLIVDRPGRMLFKYASPARFEIVADGRSVAIIDHKLNTQDEYFIGQTPLKFLLSDHIDLAKDTKVLSVAQDESSVTIEVEDKAALGGTAHLELIFDPATFALKQWTVIDAQGFQTVVTLFNVDLKTKPDPALFRINETTPSAMGRGR
ncbi:MAG TPA: outer-membrane lipoprotein carrier protein LolA [Roseiarcus sp.]|jgi:outer membrane lipoprotein-sorting protein|nr:outer-membrane lipoprotein carrier protein LolA [Roseiarcus sp.]